MRAPAEKLSIWTEGNFEVAIAGSGNSGELIDAFEERFRDELSHNQGALSLKTLKDLFQVEFQEFQRTEAASHSRSERSMSFVICARLLTTGEHALWSSRATRLKAVDKYALVGFWDERYKFAVEGYLKPNPTPTIAQGIFLGLYIMWLAEQTSNYVKSPVHVAIVKNWSIHREAQEKTNFLFERVKLFSAQFDKLFLACPDTGLQHGEFAARLNEFVATVIQLRQDYMKESVGQMLKEGLNKVNDPYNLLPLGTTFVIPPTVEQAKENDQRMADLARVLRERQPELQDPERIIANLESLKFYFKKRHSQYTHGSDEPSEDEKNKQVQAANEISTATLMGPWKVGQEICNLLARACDSLRIQFDLGENIDHRMRIATTELRIAVIEQTLAFIQRPRPSISQTSKDRQ